MLVGFFGQYEGLNYLLDVMEKTKNTDVLKGFTI